MITPDEHEASDALSHAIAALNAAIQKARTARVHFDIKEKEHTFYVRCHVREHIPSLGAKNAQTLADKLKDKRGSDAQSA